VIGKGEMRGLSQYLMSCHPTLDLDDSVLEGLSIFQSELIKWNQTVNLVSRRHPEQVSARLIMDALYLLSYLNGGEAILDIGSGAGFPSIPILLCLNVSITMVESRRKRATFLEYITRKLGLRFATVIHATVTDSFFEHSVTYDILWSKAAVPFETLFRWGGIVLKPGGRLILFHPFTKERDRCQIRELASLHGFLPPSFRTFHCRDLYLTRTLGVCQKGD